MSRQLDKAQPHVLALFRVVTGLLFACHGLSALFGVLGGAMGTGKTLPVSWPDWYAAVIQLAGGVLVLLGVGTRAAALLCSGSMAYAYFTVHVENGVWPIQNGGEMAVLYCWAFLLIVVAGPGAWALGGLFSRQAGSGDILAGRGGGTSSLSGHAEVAAGE